MTSSFLSDKNKQHCCGCESCANSCPQKCIFMTNDSEGFLYPKIDLNNCAHCDLCSKACPYSNTSKVTLFKPSAYAAYLNDDDVRKHSSSGGLFSFFAEKILEKNGIVYGAAFDKQWDVVHLAIERKEDLPKLRGSKYVQSKIGDIFADVKTKLDNNRLVYFSGTPCQITGLKLFLGKQYPNLILQDIICHGVPSPKIWQLYLDSKKAQINKINFRDKSSGWLNYSFNFNNHRQAHTKNKFMAAFLHNLSLRPSCYSCPTKGLIRNSDFTLGDLWGANTLVSKEMNDNKGLSLLIINSEKGRAFFNEYKYYLVYKEIDFEKAISFNGSFSNCSILPIERGDFFKEISSKNFNKVVDKYCKRYRVSFFKRIKNKIFR